MSTIAKVGVIGSGVMGSGIAAHLANAGLTVELLDIVPEGAEDRDLLAAGAVARLLKTDPAPLTHRAAAKRIRPGNLEDHLERLADCDWIVEAVLEDPDVKRQLYARIEAVRRPGSIVSSNTSTIPLRLLTAEMPESFRRDFLITHFFNPPRYMRLLELVAGPDTRPEALRAIEELGDRGLGKRLVTAKDTPGFVGNRIGTYWLARAVSEAQVRGISIEAADAALGRPVGVPKTGVFGLIDLVGVDLMPHVLGFMTKSLPATDAFHEAGGDFSQIEAMIAEGYIGRKGKGGFYRLRKEGGKKIKEVRDLQAGTYSPAARPKPAGVRAAKRGGPRALLEHDSEEGRYAWAVLGGTLRYAASLVPEIADDIVAVDDAMRTGYNWKWGPFELMDRLGPAWLRERLAAEGLEVPPLLAEVGADGFYREHEGRLEYWRSEGGYAPVPRPEGVLLLEDVKRRGPRLAGNSAASLWDLGDGVACLEFHTKMNAIDPPLLAMLGRALKEIPARGMKALVLHNESSNFSVGANIGLALFAANIAAWGEIEQLLVQGQETFRALKYAPFPVVGAPSGMALGGGCEVLLHCDAIQAHVESYVGLVEVGVGIVPGWGGCKELLARAKQAKGAQGPMPPVVRAFETIGMAAVAKSAVEAQEKLFFREGDGITMNRERVLADAKARALELARDYAPPEPVEYELPGPSGLAALSLALDDFRASGKATPHDVVVGLELAGVLCGGKDADPTEPLGEDEVLRLERAALLRLVRDDASLARMEHMLETGKPLRN